ncbi:MAG TPA: IS630 family transposase [Magnetospirillaceae bacterium]|nr:IS630 family transposase [Magnetospirillaceae bacterium]
MKCKKPFDARKLSHDALEVLRKGAVARIVAGEGPEAVAAGLGINRRTIYKWLAAFHYGGDEALKAKSIPGAPPKVNAKQMEKLAKIVRERTPIQEKFEYALWTLSMIRELIRRLFNVNLSEVSVGRLMKRLGFTPQRPVYRAWQQDKAVVESWQRTEYPKIAVRARKEGALIFFGDESGLRSDYHSGTTWAPQGKTPVVKATGARYGFNIISAVNARGHFRFMVVDGTVTAAKFRDFLKRLITGIDRKVFLIVDGHPVHKAKLVKDYLAENKDKLEIFFLPAYSPELNPDELAWAHLKRKLGRVASQTKEKLKKKAFSILRSIQRLPSIVTSFFLCPTCKYAL